MIKSKSKPKPKQPSSFAKKSAHDKVKISSKQATKRMQQKQNGNPMSSTIGKYNTVSNTAHTTNSKSRARQFLQQDTQREKSLSPLSTSKTKNGKAKSNYNNKHEDQNFIENLFCKQDDKIKQKKGVLLNIQNVCQDKKIKNGKNDTKTSCQQNPLPKADYQKQLLNRNQQIKLLKQSIQQHKLYSLNFVFKVYELTSLLKKVNKKSLWQQHNRQQLNAKNDEISDYLDSFVKYWNLGDKFQMYYNKQLGKMTDQKQRKDQLKKRCHTQSLKIPIQDYLQSLQNTKQYRNIDSNNARTGQDSMSKQYQNQFDEQEHSQQIMKLLSRRSSGPRKEQQQTYVCIKAHNPANIHQLHLLPGQKVTVLLKNQNTKWLGFKNGKIGYFPKQCLF